MGVALAFAHSPRAQTAPIERNIPALPSAPPASFAAPTAPAVIADDQVLAPRLNAIVALGPTAPVRDAIPASGLDLTGVARLNRREVRAELRRFLGRPLTHRLIGGVNSAIVAAYRRQGFPFVAVSTPEQEIGDGALQVRVVEFRLGEVKASPPAHEAKPRAPGRQSPLDRELAATPRTAVLKLSVRCAGSLGAAYDLPIPCRARTT